MKKCALASALVLALSTVSWGTGIEFTQVCHITTCPVGITLPVQQGVHSWAVTHVTHMYGISICHNPCGSHCGPVFQWPPCHQHGGNNTADTTTANSSSSTIASGPNGNAVADSSSSGTSAHSSSTSSSHSQSISH